MFGNVQKEGERGSDSDTFVALHLYRIEITATWNTPPNGVVSGRRVNSFKNRLDKHWALAAIIDAALNLGAHKLSKASVCWKWTQRSVLY